MATYKNVLRGKFATAASSYWTYVPAFIVDGLGNGANPPNQYRWISNTSKAGEWVSVDIGAMALIDKFILYTGNNTDGTNVANCIKNGDLQIMDEYGNWKTVASFRNNPDNGKKVELTFSPVVTDKIRLYFPIDEQQYRIFEIEAFGQILGKKAIKKPGKNLFNVKEFDSTKVIGGGTLWMYKFYGRPYTNYTFSTNAPLEGSLANFYAGGVNTGSNGYSAGSPRTVSSGTDGIITMYMRNETTTTPSEASKKLMSGEYWIQIEEGSAATAHEDYNPQLKAAKKKSTKNYAKPFNHKDWSMNPVVNVLSPRKLEMIATADWNTSRFTFNVSPGDTFTFSAKITGALNVELWEDGKNLGTFVGQSISSRTYTAKGTTWEVRLVNNNKTTGYMAIEDLQIEPGSVKTDFELYKERNRYATLTGKSLFNPNTATQGYYINDANGLPTVSGAGSSASDFIPVEPNTVYVLDKFYQSNALVMRMAFFRADKSYISGYTVSAFSVSSQYKEITTPANAAFIRFSVHPKDYGVGLFYKKSEGNKNKEATTISYDNMLPPLSDPRWYVASQQFKGEILGDYEYRMNSATDKVVAYDFPISLKGGQQYTISATLIGANARVRVFRKRDNAFLANPTGSGVQVTFTAPAEEVFVRIENNGKAGDYTVKDFVLQEGTSATFKPYNPKNRISLR
jgi:hypothetical protein